MVLILLAFQFGPEIKGAHRWITIGPLGIQPSEFVKPAFVVIAAWAFSEGARRKDMPRSEEHTSELQSRQYLVCRLLLEKKKHRMSLNTKTVSPEYYM